MRPNVLLAAVLLSLPAAAQTPAPAAPADAGLPSGGPAVGAPAAPVAQPVPSDGGVLVPPTPAVDDRNPEGRPAGDRAENDPVDPDLLPWVIPPGKEEEVKALFTGFWGSPRPGMTPGSIVIERDVVRLQLTLGQAPAELLLLHPTVATERPGQVVRKGGEAEKLVVVGTCAACSDDEKKQLGELADVVIANQTARKADLWKYKAPPAPPAKVFVPIADAGEGGAPVPTGKMPVARLFRIIAAVVLVIALFVLLRRRGSDTPPPPATKT